jgi:BirA family transcriptional regulator, biotin operon repressor / biotin---[acetyl-CoA-carboxylase] ligase
VDRVITNLPLRTASFARSLEHHDSIESTNLRARELAKSGAPHGACVVADEQTAGRGRRGRTWHSPKGAGLYVSFVVRPSLSPRDAALITLASGVALAEATSKLGAEMGLKWPNDLLAKSSRKKLAGILVDLSADASKIDHAIVGIGVNLFDVERPPEIEASAISLEALIGARPNKEELLAEIALALEHALIDLDRGEKEATIARFLSHAIGLGEPVTIASGPSPLEGTYEGLEPDGALRLRTSTGHERVYAGDLLLRGAPRAADRRG